jgi:endoribonuclease Dicer
MCADIAEALMGAYFIEGGESAALQFLQWLGLDLPSEFEYIVMSPSKTTIMQHHHHQRCSGRNEGLMAEKGGCHWLTIEALTHPSCGLPYSNQRLEFLGDAVLDFITTVQLWKMFPNQTPGAYTVWRSQLVCNQTLGRVAAKMGLATSIKHNCANTSAQLAPFKNRLDDNTMSSAAVVYPKVLADAFEAIVGSQYLQSCCSLKSVWTSIKEHILPELKNLQGG